MYYKSQNRTYDKRSEKEPANMIKISFESMIQIYRINPNKHIPLIHEFYIFGSMPVVLRFLVLCISRPTVFSPTASSPTVH